jgi:hypothetical protein
MALARICDRAQDSAIGTADGGAAEAVPAELPEVHSMMKRLIPFLSVLIVAVVFVAFASRTEQGATIRADVRKRVVQMREDMQATASDVEDAAVEVETVVD